jgi:TonB-dependent SusC/RagA subfamily outer membrane receptor
MKRILLLIVMLLYAFTFQEAYAQSIKVSGTVKDQAGQVMPGVSVLVKGTNTGVSTTADGTYAIQVPNEGQILVFSYTGMLSQEVTVGKNTTINIFLEEQTNALNDVVVVGYGSQKKSNVTGSIATVNNKELVQTPVGDLSNALAGRTPGVITKQPSGEPGADGTQIYIRGNSTFGGGSMEPLFVIDGVVRSGRDFGQMDPNEVESVSILKDASSAAIFGVKGANGVVLVTTKRGKAGQLIANYSFNYGFSKVTRLPDALGSYEYATLYNEID